MRAVVDARTFHKAVSFATTGCHHSQLLPILNNIKIETTPNKLVLMGTDMEFAVQVTMDAQVEKEGATAVNAKQLLSLLSLMKNMGKIEIESNGLFKLCAEEAEHEFPVIPADEFPLFPDEPQGLSFSLPQCTLKRMLQCTMFAMGNTTENLTVNCVLFEIEKVPQKIGHGYRFNCVATDTYRMSIISEKINISETTELPRFTVPSNSVHKLFKVLQEMDEEIKIVFSPSLVWLEIPHSDMTVHCAISNLGRNFPNYEHVLTLVEHPITQLKTSSVDLYQALKKIEPHVKTIKIPRIVFDITPECITIKFNEPDAPSEGKVKVPVVEFDGEPLQIVFNFNFIFEFVKEAKRNSAFVIMSLKGSKSCVKIDCSNEPFSYYIMPMEPPEV